MDAKSLSVFFPSYNEEGNIASTVEKAIKVLDGLKKPWEIIIVDDGSKDKTPQVADQLAKKYSKVKVLHKPNGGYGSALQAGFKSAKNDLVFYTDADGQFDFSEVRKFLELADKYDVIIGYRIERKDPFYRLIFAKIWAVSVFLMFGLWVKDIDCGFKMVKKRVIDSIAPFESTRGAMINAELIIKAKRKGFKIGQVGVYHYPRKAGKPTGASIPVIIKSYLDLVRLRLKTL